jgi:hypothetical protein
MAKVVVREWFDASLNGVSPQQAIRMLTDVINRTPWGDRRYLRIESFNDDLGNPFEQNPTRTLRIVIDKLGNTG